MRLLKMKKIIISFINAFSILLCISSSIHAQEVRPPWVGFYASSWSSNLGINSTQYPFVKGISGRIQWSDLEPSEGVFDFSTLDADINNAVNGGFYYYFVMWSGPHAPEWIYNNGVPKVDVVGSSGKPYFPYYLDQDYIKYFYRLIDKLAEHLASLSEVQRNAIAFYQPSFGSTGDQQLYKGTPVDSNYNITDQQYLDFCSAAATRFYQAFDKPELKNIKFLFNIEEETANPVNGEQLFSNWLRQNYTIDCRKQQFTVAVGYQANGEIVQDNELRPSFYGLNGKKPDIVRGEFSADFANALIFKENLKWNYYWTAISTVDRGLDIWEVNSDVVKTGLYNEAFIFANKYSYYKRPETSPYAFVALRDVLDANDVFRFPVDPYGTAVQNNEFRITKIVSEFSKYGAVVGDMYSAKTRSNADYLRNATALNDVGYKVIARNYSRFITQIDANNTSVGMWRVGPVDQPYGRYARAFENSTNKNRMYFDLNDAFLPDPVTGKTVDIKIIYLDQGTGSFSFRYDATSSSDKVAAVITKTNSMKWVEKTIKIEDGAFSNLGPNKSDFSLVNEDTEDDIFHMIEITKSSTLLSIQKNNNLLEVIYPNPTNSNVYWSNSIIIDEVFVYNLGGTVVMKIVKPATNNIDLSLLQSGMYLIKLYQKNKPIAIQKIIKK